MHLITKIRDPFFNSVKNTIESIFARTRGVVVLSLSARMKTQNIHRGVQKPKSANRDREASAAPNTTSHHT